MAPALTKIVSPTSNEELLKALRRKAWITKTARFAASRRVEKLNGVGTNSVNLLAMCALVISVVSFVYSENITKDQVRIVAVASIALAFYSIMLDMTIRAKKYEKKIFAFEHSASRINELTTEIDLLLVSGKRDDEAIKNVSEKYKQILNDFPEQHSELDYKYSMIDVDKPTSFFGKARRRFVYISYPILAFW